MQMNQACFLGAGITTHLGTGIAAQLAALQRAPLPPQPVSCDIGTIHEHVPYKLLADFPLVDIEQRLDKVIDTVIGQALAAAGFSASDCSEVSLFIGSSSFDISVSEYAYQQAQQVRGDSIPLGGSSSFGNLADTVRKRFGFRGADFSFNTACTSSANALWYASRLIHAGKIRYALVLGVEVINHITALGFHGLGLLTRSVMKPFDAARDGLVLGEAASALLLGPGNSGDFRLLGGANLCDTHSMSAANADGSSVAAVISAALAEAGLPHTAVKAIKAHGTASLLNDEAEAAGLLRVFTETPSSTMPPVCALKPFIGHTLGACGLTELILFWQALLHGFIPATAGIGADKSVLGISLNQHPQPAANGAYLLNYFGFGGNNTALLIGSGEVAAR
jgi:3-oxoacyl-[acyl-carrier-protein] synthase I